MRAGASRHQRGARRCPRVGSLPAGRILPVRPRLCAPCPARGTRSSRDIAADVWRAPCRQPLDEGADSKAEYEAMFAEQAALHGGGRSDPESEEDAAYNTHCTPDRNCGSARASSVVEESNEVDQVQSAGAAARSVAATHRKRRRVATEDDNKHEEGGDDKKEVTSRQAGSNVNTRARAVPSSPQKRKTTTRKGRSGGPQKQSSLFKFFSPSP